LDSSEIIDKQFVIKILERSLKLYTPSLGEKPLAEFIAEQCYDLGFEDIRIDDVGNVIARKGNGSPRILLCGHMDTVPGEIKVMKEGDSLFGRGSSDAKSSLIAMLLATSLIKEDVGTITFVGAVDEEGNATGIKNIMKQKHDFDYAVFGEPSGLKQITIAYKGRLAINLRINVKSSAHASAPWLSKNAIEEAIMISSTIKKALESDQRDQKKSMIITASITEIKGGSSHNVTPKECHVTLDIRIPVSTDCKSIEEKLARLISDISNTKDIEIFYSILDETEPFETSHNSSLIRAFTLGILDVERTRPTLIRKTGTGDMNIVGNQMKIPIISYGPGDPHESHTLNEKVSINEYLRGIEILQRSLVHLKRLHSKRK
jgi:LysW-gamma-L-lysine carboxypeptidase